MFKKKNKQIVSETVEEKVDKKISKAPKKTKRQGKTLSSWIYQPVLAILLCFIISLVFLELLVLVPTEDGHKDQLLKSNLSASAYDIDSYVNDKKISLQEAIRKHHSPEDLSSRLSDIWPELEASYLVSHAELQNIKVQYPDISFASVDLFRRAAEKEKSIVEAFFNENQWFYQVAVTLKDSQQEGKPANAVGSKTLLAIFDISALKNKLKHSPGAKSGRVEIVTESGRPVFGYGNGVSDGSVSAKLSIPQWSLKYSPSESILPQIDRLLVLVGIGVLALLAIILLVLILRVHVAKIRKDIQSLSQFMSKKIISGKAAKDLVFNEFVSVADAISIQLDEYSSKGKERPASKDTDKILDTNKDDLGGSDSLSNEGGASDDQDDAPLFDDDLLDLDVLDSADKELDEGASAMVTEVKSLADEVSQGIFRAYDIRGIVGETLNEGVVELIGKAIATEALSLGQQTLCVGFDGRLSSIDYCQALSRGITSTGANVIIVGQVPTPLLYFSTHHFETGSGVMITGSHNPSNYNGFKIMLAGKTLAGDDIQKLYNRIVIQDFATGQGSISEQPIAQDYMDTILDDIAVAAPLKVVVDAGNGVAGGVAPGLIEELGCEVIPLYCEVDGNFPNHHPDPGKPENFQDLIRAVQEHEADLGIAFDGDGDRVGIVTNTGKIIWPDRLLMLFAKDVVSRNPGADIIFDVKCSRRLNGLISSYGGRPIMWKTGHSLIKAKMKETGALLAGEMSGHIFFKERWFGFDDGIYSAVRLLEVLGIEDRTADDVFADFPEDVSTPEINIEVTDESKFQLVEKLSLLKGQFEGGNVSTIDGLRVDYPNGWGLCRASNTTPVLVLRFEADDEIALEEIKDKFRTQLTAVDPSLNLNF